MYWFILVFVFIIFEIATPGAFYSFCLAIGSLAAGISSLLGAGIYFQYGIFAVIALISIFAIRPVFIRVMAKMQTTKTNVDALIDKEAFVTEKIAPQKYGFVKIDGDIWLAESDSEIEAGQKVFIREVIGTRVIVSLK